MSFDSLQAMKEMPIRLVGGAARIFEGVKRERRVRSAQPIPLDVPDPQRRVERDRRRLIEGRMPAREAEAYLSELEREAVEIADLEVELRVGAAAIPRTDGPDGPVYVMVCRLCGQPTEKVCNSALHVGPGESANGTPIKSTELARRLHNLESEQ